jgi:phospholipid/cholesterol/gamma-HCH transport system substrate-binding protein
MREFHATLVAANQAINDLRRIAGEHGEGQNALKAIDDAARRFDKLAGDIDAMVQENRQPLRDFGQRGLNELSQLLIDARAMVAGLTRLADEIEHDPPRFLFGGNRREGYQPR